MTFQLDDDSDDQPTTEDSGPTLYDTYLWRIVNDPGRQHNEQFRANMNAHLIASGSTAAIEAALKLYERELDALDDEAYEHRLRQLNIRLLEEAERVTSGFTEEIDQEIRQFESEICLEALRRDMLTPHEIDTALSLLFGLFAYLEARPDVEKLLTSRDPALRRRALEVLVLSWGLFEYKETAFRFLTDPDPDCRMQGMRCLNPTGNALHDLPVLQAYAHIAINTKELPEVRLSAYSELLMAVGYDLGHDHWEEIEMFLKDGGTIEQAPWIDWELIRFFHEESNEASQFKITLSFKLYGDQADWQEWVDQLGRVSFTIEELGQDVLLPAHQLARLRFSDYQMTIILQPKKQES